MESENFKSPITHKRAKELVANYRANKKPHLDKEMETDKEGKKRETESVWFDYEFCKELIADLQRGKINGLRIYFGAYGKEDPIDYKKNKMTTVLVTTTGPRGQDWGEDDLTPATKMEWEWNEGKICPPRCPPEGAIKL